jgi:hypothetical protein
MTQSSVYEVFLPVGYRQQRAATIRKLRGHEEALLYNPALSPGQLVTELLRSCLIQIGDHEVIDRELVNQLYTADRNYLLLEVRRITLGDAMRARYLCPLCGNEVRVVENLSQVEVRWLDEGALLEDIIVELEDGYIDRDGTVHREVVLTLPRGADEEFVAPMLTKDPMQARDALLLRCIKRFGTLSREALEGYGIKILRNLTLGDRRLIFHALDTQAPGVNFQRWLRCGQCSGQFEATLDVSDFFALS